MKLERRTQQDSTATIPVTDTVSVSLAPVVDEDYWTYRVKLNDRQAVVGFPKFGTVGIGFAVEDDWNTNLPYTCQTIDIVSHIWHNVDSGKPEGDEYGDAPGDDIRINQVYAAVELIQRAATEDRPDKPGMNTQQSMTSMTVREVTA